MTGPSEVPEPLRRFLDPPAQRERAAEERCEMCATPIGPEHSHVVDLRRRVLLCACMSCALLFTSEGSGGGSFRTVPDRYRHDESFTLSAAQWDALQIPVGVAFFFTNSALGRTVALYPSPAGATESELPLHAWADVLTSNPALADVEADVEALLVRRTDEGFVCFLVPIDACYELVGLVRSHWRGFDGGTDAWRVVDRFFEQVASRCRPARQRR